MRATVRGVAAALLAACVAAAGAAARANAADTSGAPADAPLALVVVVTRHGVRSPTNATEMNAYAARPWPAWDVPPGNLTARGAELMRDYGASYRARYAALGLVPATGCPAPDAVYLWADVDQRTRATAAALASGFAPQCGLAASASDATSDPLFDAAPAIAVADGETARAALEGTIGGHPDALVPAYGLAFAKLDAILGCTSGACARVSTLPSGIKADKSGLVSVTGPVAVASTAVEDMILAYADGKPAADVGWGGVDGATLLDLSALHELKFELGARSPYASRVQGSNVLSHVLATIDRRPGGAPPAARFVGIVGHDTTISAIGGLLGLHWLLTGYARDDTPPGGALVFEVYRPAAPDGAYVRVFYEAQRLAEMRRLRPAPMPERAPVFVPGCPQLACPLATFDRIANAAIDPAFVGGW